METHRSIARNHARDDQFTWPVLVTPEQLRANPQWRVVDCSHDLMATELGAQQFDEGHIPDAIFAHMDKVLSGPNTKTDDGRHPWPTTRDLCAWLVAQGIEPEDTVVVYDRSGAMFAARLWFLLRCLGFERVSVLDGGWNAWLAAGGEVQARVQTAFQPVPPWWRDYRWHWLADMAEIEALVAHPEAASALLIDARAPERYAGEVEPLDPVAGHIPGAINRPFAANLQADGRFKPFETLRAEWLALLNAHPSTQLICYCGSGVTACHHLVALAYVGLGSAGSAPRLFPNAWSGWCANPERPVARGRGD